MKKRNPKKQAAKNRKRIAWLAAVEMVREATEKVLGKQSAQ